mmetsp:Transcript_23132/g.64260  ORF Transcript_23132/g.64260 Transcript_23132/m.64260 type:complete len:203 (-) Transcript_23132:231-839(-)
MWFSLNPAALEDTAVLSTLRNRGPQSLGLPQEMYTRDSLPDVRLARLAGAGFTVQPWCTDVSADIGSGFPLPAATQDSAMGTSSGHLWLSSGEEGLPEDRVLCVSVQHASQVGHFFALLRLQLPLMPASGDCKLEAAASSCPANAPGSCSRDCHCQGVSRAEPVTLRTAEARLRCYLGRLGAVLDDASLNWEAAGHLHATWC